MTAVQTLQGGRAYGSGGSIRPDNLLLFQNAKDQVDRLPLISAFSSLEIGNDRSAWIELLLTPGADVGSSGDNQTPNTKNRHDAVAKTVDGALRHRSNDGERGLVRAAVTDPQCHFGLPQLSLGDGRVPSEAKECQDNTHTEGVVHTIQSPLNEKSPPHGGNIASGCNILAHDDTSIQSGSGLSTNDAIPDHTDFTSDPAHEYWCWSQEEGNWWHKEEETGPTIWAPLDFD
ncbi:hypothetical protein O1611_g1062 [Lasiodiplodia mahajangana]|uniref:Uncharacterized protein n=1 Tax=Lasiodiplodia mahajangana TaxID=1108764 RepID=A0ACC2JYT0_9PEZI|nr:hypothetical protein O1611_g1062 [Lasiodiplodia mahajangana]